MYKHLRVMLNFRWIWASICVLFSASVLKRLSVYRTKTEMSCVKRRTWANEMNVMHVSLLRGLKIRFSFYHRSFRAGSRLLFSVVWGAVLDRLVSSSKCLYKCLWTASLTSANKSSIAKLKLTGKIIY